jgi:glycosyltransferase involved in cell wall biosynthesis
MRVLQVNKFLYRRGGAEAYMLDVSTLLTGHDHEVTFFGMAHPQNPPLPYDRFFPSEVEFESGVQTLRSRGQAVGRMFWSTSSARGIREVLDRVQPDVVHLHNIYHQLSPSILRETQEAGIPAVMTLHDYKLICPTYQLLDNGQLCEACVGGHFSQALRRSCRNESRFESGLMGAELALHTWMGAYGPVGRFCCPSEFLVRLAERGGVYPDRLRWVPNFVDSDSISLKEDLGGPVIYAGRLSPEKGVDVLLEAMGMLPGRQLLIAGEGPSRESLERLAEGVAPDQVRFLGRLSRDDTLAAVRSAAVLVLPARWHENQPIVVLEALASGVPVISTDLGGLPELVRPHETGLLIPPNDAGRLAEAIATVLADPQEGHRMGRRGRALIDSEFGPQKHLERLLAVYAEVGAE